MPYAFEVHELEQSSRRVDAAPLLLAIDVVGSDLGHLVAQLPDRPPLGLVDQVPRLGSVRLSPHRHQLGLFGGQLPRKRRLRHLGMLRKAPTVLQLSASLPRTDTGTVSQLLLGRTVTLGPPRTTVGQASCGQRLQRRHRPLDGGAQRHDPPRLGRDQRPGIKGLGVVTHRLSNCFEITAHQHTSTRKPCVQAGARPTIPSGPPPADSNICSIMREASSFVKERFRSAGPVASPRPVRPARRAPWRPLLARCRSRSRRGGCSRRTRRPRGSRSGYLRSVQ